MGPFTYITEVWESPKANTLNVVVVDANGNSCMDNYEILRYECGMLEVYRRRITIAADNAIKEYDGTPLTCDSVSILFGQLVEGHVLEAHAVGSITVEGTTENVIDETTLRIVDRNGNDVTDCYKITCVAGTLEITE